MNQQLIKMQNRRVIHCCSSLPIPVTICNKSVIPYATTTEREINCSNCRKILNLPPICRSSSNYFPDYYSPSDYRCDYCMQPVRSHSHVQRGKARNKDIRVLIHPGDANCPGLEFLWRLGIHKVESEEDE